MTLARSRASLALTWLALTYLPLGRRAARVSQVATGVLQAGSGSRQVSGGGHPAACTGQRLSEAVKCRPGALGVTLRKALSGVAQCRAGRPVCLRSGRPKFGQLAGEIALLLRRQLVQPVAKTLEVVAGFLRIAVAVRLGLAGGGARQGSAE